jgi:hypothetical protein
VVIRAIRLVFLQHESDVLVGSINLPLNEAHGASMDEGLARLCRKGSGCKPNFGLMNVPMTRSPFLDCCR